MKVNDYVRTKEFGINKVKWFDNEEPILENGFTALQSSGYKSSPNIIDLIEVEDYVNGSYVEGFIEKNKFQNKLIITEAGMIDNNDIKSIVTKEMYASVEYRVETN